jgi:hypothetical protein
MSIRLMMILCVLGFGIAGPLSARANLRGHQYTNDLHQLTVTRPDATWELRENIPLPTSVCAFVVDGGSAAVILGHRTLSGDQILRDINDLEGNRSLLNKLITGSVFIETGNLEFRSVEYREDDGQIVFDLMIDNREPERGPLENHVVGFIVRDANDVQHLYAMRCATTRGSFLLWESQFDRIVPTLAFTGDPVLPVYRSRPTPTWWWIAGGLFVLILLSALRGRGRTEPETLTRVPHRVPKPEVTIDPIDPIAPVDIAGETDSSYSDIPEFLRHSNPTEAPPPGEQPADALADTHRPAATGLHPDPATDAPEIGATYWTCGCGRKNVGTEAFCSRCNADRA